MPFRRLLLDNGITCSPPGVGKTHLAIALGREAIVAGDTVLFTGAMELVATLAKAQVDGRFEERLTQYAKPKLLIVPSRLLQSKRREGSG